MSEELRSSLKAKMQADNVSLRDVSALTGVSPSTLSRFLRQYDSLGKNIEAIKSYVTGKDMPKRKEISSRRMTVGGKTFLITIEELQS